MKRVKRPATGLLIRFSLAAALLMGLGAWPSALAQDAEPPSEPDASPSVEEPTIDPEVQTALLQVGALMREEKMSEAEALLTGLLEDHPGEPNVRKQLSLIKIQNEDHAAAIQLIEPLLEQQRDDFVLLNNAAWIYATIPDKRIRDSAKAVSLAQETILLAPNNYHVWSTLAEAYYADGDFDRAKKASDETLRLAGQAQAQIDADVMAEFKEQAVRINRAVRALSLIE